MSLLLYVRFSIYMSQSLTNYSKSQLNAAPSRKSLGKSAHNFFFSNLTVRESLRFFLAHVQLSSNIAIYV